MHVQFKHVSQDIIDIIMDNKQMKTYNIDYVPIETWLQEWSSEDLELNMIDLMILVTHPDVAYFMQTAEVGSTPRAIYNNIERRIFFRGINGNSI